MAGVGLFKMLGAKTGHKGSNVREICPQLFTERVAQYLENSKKVEAPTWATHVKTGNLKQMPPCNNKWWFTRAASILRQVYLHPHTSVSELRHRYGGSKNYGTAPRHHCVASGKIIRQILQDLEKAALIKTEDNGRIITPQGQKLLDGIAVEINKSQ